LGQAFGKLPKSWTNIVWWHPILVQDWRMSSKICLNIFSHGQIFGGGEANLASIFSHVSQYLDDRSQYCSNIGAHPPRLGREEKILPQYWRRWDKIWRICSNLAPRLPLVLQYWGKIGAQPIPIGGEYRRYFNGMSLYIIKLILSVHFS
jgi:hypothetical protein